MRYLLLVLTVVGFLFWPHIGVNAAGPELPDGTCPAPPKNVQFLAQQNDVVSIVEQYNAVDKVSTFVVWVEPDVLFPEIFDASGLDRWDDPSVVDHTEWDQGLPKLVIKVGCGSTFTLWIDGVPAVNLWGECTGPVQNPVSRVHLPLISTAAEGPPVTTAYPPPPPSTASNNGRR